jgi:hypothetical protein
LRGLRIYPDLLIVILVGFIFLIVLISGWCGNSSE